MSTSSLSPGVIIAETYEVERLLGRGGMGEVWLAKHRRLAGKHVAVKVLHVDRELPQEAVARFKREAEIAARLEHPNIVQVLDYNTLPTGEPYLVMEYLKGQSLAARAQGKPISLELMTTVMRQVGAALQAAHAGGVVHRDLKPENIFLVPTALGDQVKVLDFGISKLPDSKSLQTTDSVLIGTPLYMSPEQAQGQNRDIGPQSDLFSLGSIAYEMVTGRAPFLADSIAKVVFRIAYEKHPPLGDERADLTPAIKRAIEHALEKDRTQRTPSIEVFVEELTGQPLATVRDDETSGVFTDAVPVSASMISGETRPGTPSPAVKGAMATPPPQTPYDAAPVISGRRFIVAVIVAVAVVSAIVTKLRMDNWKEREAYRATMIDAGWVLMPDGDLTRDAGALPSTVDSGSELPRAVVDSGAVEMDAGLHAVVDAGSGAATRLEKGGAVEPPLSPLERDTLRDASTRFAAGKYDAVWENRGTLRLACQSPGARRQLTELLLLIACHRRDLSGVSASLQECQRSHCALRPLKQQCRSIYPDSEALDWP